MLLGFSPISYAKSHTVQGFAGLPPPRQTLPGTPKYLLSKLPVICGPNSNLTSDAGNEFIAVDWWGAIADDIRTPGVWFVCYVYFIMRKPPSAGSLVNNQSSKRMTCLGILSYLTKCSDLQGLASRPRLRQGSVRRTGLHVPTRLPADTPILNMRRRVILLAFMITRQTFDPLVQVRFHTHLLFN